MAAGSKRHPSPGVKSLYFPAVPSRRTAPASVLDLEQYHPWMSQTLRPRIPVHPHAGTPDDTDVSLSTMSISLPVILADNLGISSNRTIKPIRRWA